VRIDPRIPDSKGAKEKSHNFKQVSAWHSSAAVTEDGLMYVWGAGIFGEFKKPRKVKLQNNILIDSIHVGGSFIVLVDTERRIVVWGSNSNGEIGVGDSKVRNHPTRLETIDEKQIAKVSVGSSFAFAIGKTSNRQENSIFNESAMRSHISAVKNSESKIADPNEFDHNRTNQADIENGERERVQVVRTQNRDMTINSLEEQLKQISMGTPNKNEKVDESHG
jgi:alpha-tubulin suppressor-like RCC1 family protein